MFRPQVGQGFLVGLERLSLLVYRFFGFDEVVLSLADGGGRVAQLGCLEADRALIGLKWGEVQDEVKADKGDSFDCCLKRHLP